MTPKEVVLVRQTCAHCHFFVKQTREGDREHRFVVNQAERKQAKLGNFDWQTNDYAIACAFSVWDQGYQLDIKERHAVVARVNRKGQCFFWPHRPGMLIPAAKVLQERESSNKAATRDRRLTIVGLFIAAIALLVNAYVAAASQLLWWPFK